MLPGALDEQEGFYTNSHGENDCWHHAWLLQWLLWTQRCHHQCHHRAFHKWFLRYLASLRLLKQDAATPVSYGEPWPSGRSWRRCGPQCQQMAPTKPSRWEKREEQNLGWVWHSVAIALIRWGHCPHQLHPRWCVWSIVWTCLRKADICLGSFTKNGGFSQQQLPN